ncbi:Auxin response factor 17 [Hibiscus syriacus]|uniref:Auxin response factor n=1 Tax=Hibiscus syriacus TaxID=106335 RepID=A0A6A3CQD9_HIBSY|nr:auxin response factor 17-like [Hibiscus syriacus]KAE8729349.1 Auxin response factor 17 [Hibiscus syriacus]
MPPPRPPAAEVRHLDSSIWRACAGSSVRIPVVNSRVYYFPQGHVEQSCGSAPLLSSLVHSRPLIICIISDVHFLADPKTEEVFVKLFLVPAEPSRLPNQFLDINGDVEDSDKIFSFSKILTPSDANNGGGFSVPRFCADSIFPPLDYNAEPPVQTLSVTDVRGGTWEFRHIYRGTPRRHLLTTGWSKFVNQKKLIAGDSVVFMRDVNSKMFIGVRRAMKKGEGGGDSGRWREPSDGGAMKGEGRGWMKAEAVAESAERAAKGLPFEVVYYPRPGWTDFVVRAELVEAGLSICWSGGTRVKMAVETEDSSRMLCFQGTVISAAPSDSGPWIGSPWRMLLVAWDDPDVLQNTRRVSPWQVEISSSLPLYSSFPSAKKYKLSRESGLADAEGEIFFPMAGLTNSTIRHMNPSLLNYNCFPASMQGARQNPFLVQGSTNCVSENTPMMSTDSLSSNLWQPKLNRISTELNIGSSQSDNLSPDSQSSMVSLGTEFTENVGRSSSKVGVNSFQLFGQIIHPVGSIFGNVGRMEDDSGKRYDEVVSEKNTFDLSSTYGFLKLLDGIDDQCEKT